MTQLQEIIKEVGFAFRWDDEKSVEVRYSRLISANY
jgi:hypothetical protein